MDNKTKNKMTEVERNILMNQYRILSIFESDERMINIYQKKQAILESNFTNSNDFILGNEKPIGQDIFDEAITINKVFVKIREVVNSNEPKLDLGNLNFFGFHNSTPHYHVYRYIKLGIGVRSKDELWRYRNRNENSLECYREVVNTYQTLILTKDGEEKVLTTENIKQLIDVANKYIIDDSDNKASIAAA